MKKGISAISGVTSPTVGEKYTYHISEWYPNTPISEREQAKVTWELFKKRSDGRFTTTHIKKKGDSSFTFGESSVGETYRLEGYLYQPEGGGLIITPKASKIPKICKVDLNYVDDSKGSVFSFTEKLRAKAHCINMFNKEVLFTLWEDDAKGNGHNTTNQLIDTKKAKVDLYGDAEVDFMLTKALMKKAMEGETDIRELEFYVTVEYYKTKKHTTSNVEVKNPSPTENKKPSQPTAIKKAKGSPAEHKPRSKKEEKGVFRSISETIDEIWDWAETQGIAQRDKPHTIEIPEGKSPAVIGKTKVEKASVETIIDVYFAKEEFTKETTEKTGTHQYKFQNENKNIDKDKIATIIKKKVDEAIRKDKKYSKLDDIKAALTKTTYAKNEVISFDVYKLGSNLVKINNAPLEEEIYIVAKTVLLEGKEVNIKIKEKEEILIAKAADLPIQEAKKDGAELTTLKATVEKGEAKIKIKLRPKSDGDLKKWKEKLAGIKDGQHTYTFGGKNDTSTDAKKKTVAGIIIKKIKDELAKNKKFAKSEDIVKTMANASYDKGEKITFDTYKVPTEYLWLQAECQGDVKKHEGEFLKKDGEYFEIGKKCECEARIRAFMRMLRVGEGTGELIKSYDKKTKQTVYVKNDFEKSYTTAYGGNKINDLSTHPQLIYEDESSAAGAYQVMRYVWWELSGFEVKNKSKTGVYNSKNDLLKKYNINDFSEESQDKICLVLMNKQRPNLIRKIINNDIKNSINKEACFIWASLPEDETNSHYKLNGKLQPATPLKDCIEHYEEFFKEEISQKSPLHLKEGFLKELGITCCNNGEKSKWTNPLKNSQRTYYNSSGVHKEQNGAFGPVRLKPDGTKKNHQGLDLFAEVGTSCFACLDGEIVSYKNEGDDGYGNVLVLKVKGEDLRNSKNSYELEFADEVISGSGFDLDSEYIYLRYAHLESALITSGEVKSGEEICKTGDTGNAKNAVNPHLHFEVAMKSSGNGSGLSNRHNPAFFVNLESIDEPKQTKTKNK